MKRWGHVADKEFIAHIIDMLSPLGSVRARAMFGGHGFYLDDIMFALMADDVLYLKVDTTTEPTFAAQGLDPFVFTAKSGRQATMSYRTAPPDAMDDADALVPWARLAVEASRRANREKARAKSKSKSKTAAARRKRSTNSTKSSKKKNAATPKK